ncbi:MAG: NADH-quinone oxidoreductase subunit C [Candidatus Cryosericum sp.]
MEIKDIERVVKGSVIAKRSQRLSIKVESADLVSTVHSLKLLGFNQLTLVTAVDWIDEQQFEVVYLLSSHAENVVAIVKTRIPRESAEIETIEDLYPNAHKYEVELTEMFGIRVRGNADSGKPFMLENWQDLPPMRKDFDSIKYAGEHYEARHKEVTSD